MNNENYRRRPTRADTARPPLVLGHGLGSRPLCLATADKHLWRSLELGKDLARTWQEIASSECLKQPETNKKNVWVVLEVILGVLEVLSNSYFSMNCRAAEFLSFFIPELLVSWIPDVLSCWIPEFLNCWVHELLNCWIADSPTCWIPEFLRS